MNKMMIVAVAATVASTVFGAKPVPTFEQVKASYEVVKQIAVTNVVAARNKMMNDFYWELGRKDLFVGADADAFRKTVDDTLSVAGIKGVGYMYTKSDVWSKKMDKLDFDERGISIKSPYLVSLAIKYDTIVAPEQVAHKSGDIIVIVGLINEGINLLDGRYRPRHSDYSMNRLRIELQKACVKPVKKYLRSRGKSFITKDGVNPCEEFMTELNTALNAPYFNGLNAWFAKIGINASVDTSKLPTPSESQALKNAILNADKDLTPMSSSILKFCLGVDGYNAFVKEYNGEQ